MEFELQSNQIYKVWPKQQNLGAFVQGRAGQVIDDKLTRYFEPLTTVRFTTMEFFPSEVTCLSYQSVIFADLCGQVTGNLGNTKSIHCYFIIQLISS